MGVKQSKLSDGTQLTAENVFRSYEEKFPKSGKMPKSKKRVAEGEGVEEAEPNAKLDDATICLRVIESQWPKLVASESGRKEVLRLSQQPLISILKSDNLQLSEGGEFLLFLLVGAWAERRVYIESKKKQKEEKRKGRGNVFFI